jgi:hypothetical protein
MTRSVLASINSVLDRNVRKNCQLSVISRGTSARPVPTPNQPGTIYRVWVHPNTHGIARTPPAADNGRVPNPKAELAGRTRCGFSNWWRRPGPPEAVEAAARQRLFDGAVDQLCGVPTMMLAVLDHPALAHR